MFSHCLEWRSSTSGNPARVDKYALKPSSVFYLLLVFCFPSLATAIMWRSLGSNGSSNGGAEVIMMITIIMIAIAPATILVQAESMLDSFP